MLEVFPLESAVRLWILAFFLVPPSFFAVHFFTGTGSLAKLKQLLGHSTIKSTEHYLRYTVEDIREEYTEAFRW